MCSVVGFLISPQFSLVFCGVLIVLKGGGIVYDATPLNVLWSSISYCEGGGGSLSSHYIVGLYDTLSKQSGLLSNHIFFSFLFRTLLLSSFWTSRGHRCRPFFPPVLAFNFYRA